jgi:isopentenyl diphosphate isomerase/L-lactate dehydrogenase-like FMN-dependent dehydrogenase
MERERELQKKQEAERKRLEAKIKRAENSGKESRVNQLRFEADNLPEHIEVKAEAKVKGIRKLWRGKVSNPNEVKENAEQLYEMGLLVPDSEAINSFARATKGKVVLKGISVWEEEILAGRTT